MNAFDALKGNEQLKSFFKAQIAKRTLAHAYILEGEAGSGRHTLALAVAQALAGDTPEGRKIARGLSPDVRVFGPPADKKQFTVDVVRALRSEAFILPGDLPFKFFILEKAETMNIAAQNAALKILEEPPENTFFFLLCTSVAQLLPTVRSRAPALRMQRFTTSELDALFESDREIYARKKQDEANYYACLRESAGSYGEARRLLVEGNSAESKKLASELISVFGDRAALLLASAKLPKKRQELEEVFTKITEALRDVLICRAGGREETLIFYSSLDEARRALPGRAKEQIIALIDLFDDLQRALSGNANVQNLRFALVTGVSAALAR